MPKVPTPSQQFSLNTPGAQLPSDREFGRVGAALSGAGNDVQQAGVSIYHQIAQAEAVNDSSNAYAQYKLDSDRKMIDLKLQSPDGYIHEDPKDATTAVVRNEDGTKRTMDQEFYDWSNSRYQDDQSSMGTELGARMYRERTLPHISDQMTLVQNEAQTMKVKAFDQNQELRIKAYGDAYGKQTFLSSKPTYDSKTGQLVTDPITKQPVYQSTFNTDNFYRDVQDLAKDGQANIGVMHNATENQAKQAAFQKQLSMDYLRTVYTDLFDEKKEGSKTTRIQDVHAAYDLVRGTDPQSVARRQAGLPVFSDMMDPAQRETELKKILGLLPTAQGQDWENYKKTFEDGKDALSRGFGNDGVFRDLLRQTVQYAQANEKNQADAAQRVGELFAANEKGKLIGPAWRNAPDSTRIELMNAAEFRAKAAASQFAKELKLPNSEVIGSKASGAITSEMLAMDKQVRDQKQHDLVAFAQNPVPEENGKSNLTTGARVAQIDHTNLIGLALHGNPQAYQAFSKQYNSMAKTAWADHPENVRSPITKEQSATVADRLKDVNGLNEAQAGQDVSSLSHYWRKDFPRNVDQMIKDGYLPPQYRIMELHAHDSPDAQMYLMSALRGGNAEDKNFKDTLGAPGTVKEGDIRGAVAKYTQPWIRSQTQGDPYSNQALQMANNIQDTVFTGALKELRKNGNLDYDSAAKSAYDKLIGNFAHVNSMGASHWYQHGVSSVDSIPKVYKGQPIADAQNQTIVQNLNEDMKNLQKFEPAAPRLSNGQPDPQADHFLEMVQKTAHPTLTRQPEFGHNIQYTDATGFPRLLMHMNVAGKPEPIFIPLSDSLKPRAEAPGVMDNIKKFVPSFMGGHQ